MACQDSNRNCSPQGIRKARLDQSFISSSGGKLFQRGKEEKTFHERAIERGKFWEYQVAENLSDIVFNDVFPALLTAIKEHDREAPDVMSDAYLADLGIMP
ncbi:MAG: hypothetical protein IPH04_19780 [Saprospirales bacterium]|nr:hypothetical protein [Saprospirales bacterium]